VIVLLGVLRGHHDALLGWMKISVFERETLLLLSIAGHGELSGDHHAAHGL